jgi:starch synthase
VAGSDFYLLPARAAHDVDTALCAMRYGAAAIARPVGALADTLVDADANLETGNAFLCEGESPEELLATVQRALGAYAKHHAFEAFRKRIMKTDVSWERAARRYEHGYKQIKAASSAAA